MRYGDVAGYHSSLVRQANEAAKAHDIVRETFLRGAVHALETVWPHWLGHQPVEPV